VIPTTLATLLVTVPLAALVGPLVWMASRSMPDGG